MTGKAILTTANVSLYSPCSPQGFSLARIFQGPVHFRLVPTLVVTHECRQLARTQELLHSLFVGSLSAIQMQRVANYKGLASFSWAHL